MPNAETRVEAGNDNAEAGVGEGRVEFGLPPEGSKVVPLREGEFAAGTREAPHLDGLRATVAVGGVDGNLNSGSVDDVELQTVANIGGELRREEREATAPVEVVHVPPDGSQGLPGGRDNLGLESDLGHVGLHVVNVDLDEDGVVDVVTTVPAEVKPGDESMVGGHALAVGVTRSLASDVVALVDGVRDVSVLDVEEAHVEDLGIPEAGTGVSEEFHLALATGEDGGGVEVGGDGDSGGDVVLAHANLGAHATLVRLSDEVEVQKIESAGGPLVKTARFNGEDSLTLAPDGIDAAPFISDVVTSDPGIDEGSGGPEELQGAEGMSIDGTHSRRSHDHQLVKVGRKADGGGGLDRRNNVGTHGSDRDPVPAVVTTEGLGRSNVSDLHVVGGGLEVADHDKSALTSALVGDTTIATAVDDVAVVDPDLFLSSTGKGLQLDDKVLGSGTGDEELVKFGVYSLDAFDFGVDHRVEVRIVGLTVLQGEDVGREDGRNKREAFVRTVGTRLARPRSHNEIRFFSSVISGQAEDEIALVSGTLGNTALDSGASSVLRVSSDDRHLSDIHVHLNGSRQTGQPEAVELLRA